MTGVLTKKLDVDVTNRFIDDVKSTNNNFYVFVGHSTPWANDSSPPAANLAVTFYDHEVFDNILYGKKVTNNDIKQSIRRVNWTNNTLYYEYDKDNANLYSNSYNFYVYNTSASVKSVFKVIEAGSGNSVVAPSIISTSPFKTSDGYIWKYMYTITDSDMNKFGSNNYLPITPNSSVTSAAIPGGIDAIKVTSGGSGWVTFNTGILQSVVNSSAVVISSNASSNNDFYVNSAIYFKSGLGSGQIRRVTDYDGTSKVLFVDESLDIKTNLTLANVTGTFAVNDTVTQNLVALSITSQSGYIQPGDTITQSNTGATATIVTANSTYLRVKPLTSTEFDLNLAIDAGRGTTIGNSTVTTSTSSNTVTAAANAAFLTFYTIGDYIKVGTYFHRVTAVANNTSLTIAGPFGASYSANAHYKVNSAATVESITNISASGNIVFADVNSSIISIGNVSGSYVLGEILTQSSSSTNGVISFANSSTLILSSITGTGFVVNATVVGVTSNTSANAVTVTSNPTVTLSNTAGAFIYGANVTSTSGGTAKVASLLLLPNEQTEYIVSPLVTITGDGVNAAAYSLVNTSTTAISSIVVFDQGRNYTSANASISANPNYGSNATLRPLISPVLGHGSNSAFELGASYVSMSVTFANSSNENYDLPGYGQFRTVGLIKDPLFDNVFLTINDYDRVKISLTGANTFTIGNVLQQANIATGTVVYANTSYVELSSVNGTFDKNSANLIIKDIITEMTSTIANVVTSEFTSPGVAYQQTTGAVGNIVSSNTTTIRLSNVQGTFISGNVVYQTTSNAYANVTAVKTANNLKTLTFDYFNQLTRTSLSEVTGNFSVNESIEVRTPIGTVISTAVVYNTNNDIDVIISGNTIAFTLYERIDFGTSANGVLIGANSSYLKLTNVKGDFLGNTVITGNTSGANATVSSVKEVIVLADLDGVLSESTNNVIVGLTSNAQGYASNPNTIVKPMLVRDTGSVLYIENISPVTRTDTSRESVNLVIKF